MNGPVRQWSCGTLEAGVSLLSTKAMALDAGDLQAKIKVLMPLSQQTVPCMCNMHNTPP